MSNLLGYIVIALIGFFCICILYSPIYFILRKRVGFLRQFISLLLGFSIFLILYMTIFIGGIDFNSNYHLINVVPFKFMMETYDMGYRAMISQVISNMVMFIPIGLLLPIVFKKCREFKFTALYVFLFTFSIELIQYFIGRSCDVDDIIMNFLGGVVGYGIYIVFRRFIEDKI